MHIAILGTGHMATTLAQGITAAGHTVTFASRDPEAHTELGDVTDLSTAVLGADIVISALQASHSLEALAPHAETLAGHVLLDIGNAVTERFELIYPHSSLGAALQQALPSAHVVKSLNTLAGTVAINPAALSAPTSVFLSGDDSEAKTRVSGLLADLGWPASQQIDLGGIETARGPEHYFALFAAMMMSSHSETFNIAVVRAA